MAPIWTGFGLMCARDHTACNAPVVLVNKLVLPRNRGPKLVVRRRPMNPWWVPLPVREIMGMANIMQSHNVRLYIMKIRKVTATIH